MKTCPKCGTEYPDTTTLCPADGVALEKGEDSLIGETLAGKYRIEERLSEGGMGAVYRATHVLMDKTVAVKVLRPSLAADEKIVARFSREARAASRISHPHALSVTDFGESEDGVVYLVMEYLSGKTLKELIRQEGPMPLGRVVEIMRQVGGALDAAHAQGVVHRDLKSDNIMLLSTTGADYAKVLDFGIAKIKEPEGTYDPALTAPDLVIGTPQYMSPEQCSQAPGIDASSDIYSLGVILYEMFAGHVPFSGDSATAIMLKHLQEPVPSILEERKDLPPSVARIIAHAMAKLPDNRYQRVGDLVQDLVSAAEAGESLTSAPARPAVPAETTSHNLRDESEEQTLVRPRPPVPSNWPGAVASGRIEQRPAGLDPWKILVPSLAGLLLIFGVVWAFSRKSESINTNQTQPALVADPNSSPVEAASPATGKPEQGIPAGGTTTNQPTNGNANTNANANANVNANAESSAEEETNPDLNANVNSNSNANVNTNRRAPAVPLPSPTQSTNANDEPPPAPSATPAASPKPSLPAPTVSPDAPSQ